VKQTWQNLIFLLNKMADLYAELLELGKAKKEILVSGKADNLPPLTKQEEVLVLKAGKFETARLQLVAELAAHYGRKPEEVNLTELERLSQAEGYFDVQKAGERLKTIVGELSDMNELNAQLTKQALFFVNCNINLLMQNTADSTYAPVNNSPNQSGNTARSRLLIDRKV
jgi:flagellar biosynthesis/type III secretory pathway chaperone